MFYFHNNLKSHRVFNASLQPKYFTLPKQSGVLATEEDVTTNTLVSMIQKPTITFPGNGSINYNNVINYTPYIRNPLYLGSKTHTSFEVAFDIGFTNIFRSEKIADTNELGTTMSLPLDISKTTLYIRIKFHSGLYSSPWSDPIKVTTKEFKINVPTIITPTNNSSVININIVISTSAFSYVGVADTHESTTYQISTDVNFSSIVFNSTSITALRSIIANVEDGKTYYIRVRYNGKKYGSSDWSPVIRFTIPTFKINTPSITSPTNGGSFIVENITISTSAFSYVGVSDTHVSTTYQVSTNTAFTGLVLNTTSTTALRSLIASVGYGKTYYIRVRHNGKNYGSSDWSPVIRFTIPTFKINTPSIKSPTNGASGLSNNLVVSCTSLSFVGVGETLSSVTYQIATDANFSNLVVNSNIAAYSYTFGLAQGVTYYIRVRHNGKKYGSSNWSGTVRISTLQPITVPTTSALWNTNTDGWGNGCKRYTITNAGEVIRGNLIGGKIKDWKSNPGNLFANPTGVQVSAFIKSISTNSKEHEVYTDGRGNYYLYNLSNGEYDSGWSRVDYPHDVPIMSLVGKKHNFPIYIDTWRNSDYRVVTAINMDIMVGNTIIASGTYQFNWF